MSFIVSIRRENISHIFQHYILFLDDQIKSDRVGRSSIMSFQSNL